MLKTLKDLPVFDAKRFINQASGWKDDLQDGPGANRIVLEWGVQTGPHVRAFPAANRGAGVELVTGIPATTSDERWADFLEYEFVPQIVSALTDAKMNPQIRCVDLRPIQTMRARRRALEAAGRVKTGDANNPHPLAPEGASDYGYADHASE